MTEQLEILITLLLYTLFFAWIGYQRGSKREAVVAVAALGGWVLVQAGGDILVRIANLGGKFMAFVRAGGLGENPDAAFDALGNAPQWVTADQRNEFLFIIWVIILVLAYVVSNLKPLVKGSKSDGLAVILGIFNGLLFAAILLPKLATLIGPAGIAAGQPAGPIGLGGILGVLTNGLGLVRTSAGDVWGVFEPAQRSLLLLILLTAFLLLAASTLKGGSKKSSSTEKRSGANGTA
jgi:hypothetical protein